MAITGRFAADFSDFLTAVTQADAKLADFQSGAGRVESALNKMVDALSGRKLIQDATLAAEAVDRIGGASKLTEQQLQRLAVQASEAVAKMKAMGVDVPPGITRLAGALQPVGSSISTIGDQATRMGERMIEAFAIREIVRWVLELGEAQKQLEILSLQTQTGVEDLQILGAATKEYGVDADQLGRAIFQLSRRMAGGDESAATGLHLIGLSLDEVRDKKGMDLFLTIERGLATLDGTLRDTAAADLYGGKLGASMGAFATGADEAVAKAQRLNTILSQEGVHELAEYAREVDRAKTSLGNMAAEQEGKAAGGFNVLTKAVQDGGSKWRIAAAVLSDFNDSLSLTGPAGHALADVLDHLNQKTTATAAATKGVVEEEQKIPVVLSAQQAALRFLSELEKDSSVALEGYQVEALKRMKEIGELNAKNAAAIGVNAVQFAKYTAEQTAADKAAEVARKQLEKANTELAKSAADTALQQVLATGTASEIIIAKNHDVFLKKTADLVQYGAKADEVRDAEAAKEKATNDRELLDQTAMHSGRIKDAQDLAATALRTYLEMVTSGGYFREELDKQKEKYRELAFAATASGHDQVDAENKTTEASKKHTAELEKQQALDKAIAEEEKKRANREMGGSVDYSAPGALDKPATTIDAYLGAFGGNFAAAGAAYNADQAARARAKAALAGGAAGGSAAAILLPPSVPFKGGSGSGGGLTLTMNISGVWDPATAKDLAKAVSDAVGRQLAGG